MIRFITYAFPLLLLLLALFGFTVEILDLEPRSGAVVRLALFEQPKVPAAVVLGSWIMEACGLLALFLLAQGRCGTWWLDGLVAGWLAWVFRGPLLVLTVVVAARQPQQPWWDISLGWWILYSICGLSLAFLARRSGLVFPDGSEEDGAGETSSENPTEIPVAPPAVEPVIDESAPDADDSVESAETPPDDSVEEPTESDDMETLDPAQEEPRIVESADSDDPTEPVAR